MITYTHPLSQIRMCCVQFVNSHWVQIYLAHFQCVPIGDIPRAYICLQPYAKSVRLPMGCLLCTVQARRCVELRSEPHTPEPSGSLVSSRDEKTVRKWLAIGKVVECWYFQGWNRTLFAEGFLEEVEFLTSWPLRLIKALTGKTF